MFRPLLECLNHKFAAVVIIIVGLLIRIVFLLFLSPSSLVGDARQYYQMALAFTQNSVTVPYWPPGFPLYLAPFLKLLGGTELVSRIAMLPAYIVFMAFSYVTARKLTNRKITGFFLCFLALYPTFIYHAVEPFTQLPAAACLIMVTYFSILLLDGKGQIWISVALGVTIGILTLIRPASLILLVFIPLLLWLNVRKYQVMIVPVLVGVMLVGSWIFRTYVASGEVVFINTANARNLFIGNNPYTPLYKTWWFGSHKEGDVEVPDEYIALEKSIVEHPPAVQENLYRQAALEHIWARPDLFLWRTLSRVRAFFAFDTFAGATLIKNGQVNEILSNVVDHSLNKGSILLKINNIRIILRRHIR